MDTITGVPRVVEQELVAHVYAAVGGPEAGRARDMIRLVWARCRESLGMTDPVASTGSSDPGVLAVQQSPDRSFQAVLRREHDVLNLSLLLAPSDDAEPAPSLWQRMDRLLDTVIGDSPDDFIGVARLYLAKVTDEGPLHASPRLGSEIAELLPTAQQETGWWHRGFTTASGLTIWEVSPREDTRTERRIVTLAPPHGDRDLSVLTWSDGEPLMPQLARYLMHTAKIRYELRVHAAATPADRLCRRVDNGTGELRALIDARTQQNQTAGLDRPPDISDRLAALRTDRALLAERTAALKAMRLTVEIAAANAAATLDIEAPISTGNDLFSDDRAMAGWFAQQLDDEVTYLESSYEGARRLSEIVGEIAPATRTAADPLGDPVFGIVTAMPEEFVAMSALIDDPTRDNVENDRANYILGTLPGRHPDRPHRVVLTLLGDTGNDAAADACANLARSFGSVGYLLMVGVAAGVPNPHRPQRHVRLGDIVVSTWGIVDYDHVTDTVAGPVQRQPFPRPSRLLAQCANWLAAEEMWNRRPWETLLDMAEAKLPAFGRPPANTDWLYPSDSTDQPVSHSDMDRSEHRNARPKVHHGFIGSADRALRNAQTRDELAAKHDIRAFEMEGKGIGNAGFANGLEWLVIRGISDYGDSRTDALWRKYASLAAAAYTRSLLAECPPLTRRGGHTGGVRGHGGPR